ncbi:hypothetical protein AB0H73_06290 [Streptomyces olivoreticuli]
MKTYTIELCSPFTGETIDFVNIITVPALLNSKARKLTELMSAGPYGPVEWDLVHEFDMEETNSFPCACGDGS